MLQETNTYWSPATCEGQLPCSNSYQVIYLFHFTPVLSYTMPLLSLLCYHANKNHDVRMNGQQAHRRTHAQREEEHNAALSNVSKYSQLAFCTSTETSLSHTLKSVACSMLSCSCSHTAYKQYYAAVVRRLQ